jgi:dTDP-4-dehydrorhamnose reductase
MKRKIIVTGAGGQLGKCVADVSSHYPEAEFYFFGREELPVDDAGLAHEKIAGIAPEIVINTAAYTAVDKAETDTSHAFLINGEAVGNLATICKGIGARLIHVSTDYVFDGNADQPYKESDPVSPINQYGASKLKGEELALAADPASIIVRSSWVYSRHGSNFVKTMLRLMQERQSINVVNDQFGCPTYAIDLANALVKIALNSKQGGIYHFSNSGPITWFDFAAAIRELIQSTCEVNPVPTTSFPTPAKRPRWSVMNNDKIFADYGIRQLPWKERLEECLSQLTAAL